MTKRLWPTPDLFKFSLLMVFVFLISLGGCTGSAPLSKSSATSRPMKAYLQPGLNENGILEPMVHITVPINKLVFSQQDGVLSGGLEVVVVAWLDDDQVGGGVGIAEFQPLSRSAADTDSLFAMDIRVPLDTTAEVVLEVRARSLGTSRTWVQHIVCRPGEWQKWPLAFTQWQWNPDAGGLLPQLSESLKVDLQTGLVSKIPGNNQHSVKEGTLWGELTIELSISGRDGFDLVLNQPIIPCNDEIVIHDYHFEIPANQLKFGQYKVLASLISQGGQDNQGSQVENEGKLINPWYPTRSLTVARVIDFSDSAWNEQIEWLENLVTSEQINGLKKTPMEKREHAWRMLWESEIHCPKGRNGEQDHLLIVLEADRRFDGPQRGSKTDRGRAFIRYGAPDHLEHKGNMQGRYRRWEIWHYRNLGLALTFLDAHGLDEYRLIETKILSDS